MSDASARSETQRRPLSRALLQIGLLTICLLGLPLLGPWLAGEPLGAYLELPPRTEPARHAAFSWPVFAGVTLLTALAIGIMGMLAFGGPSRVLAPRPVRSWPWWGWAALALLAVSWLLAWTRFEWMEPFQRMTFTPLWLGYIGLINAATYRQGGRCLLTDYPRFLLLLFPASALFWWCFEYLNQFVRNWDYAGMAGFSPEAYVANTTLGFATVLPAVASTYEWLRSLRGLNRAHWDRPLRLAHPRSWAAGGLVAAAAGLALIGLWPDRLFSLVWLAPLLVVATVPVLTGESTMLAGLADGRWHLLYLPALAALVCGLLWELWNEYSLSRWTYMIPYVERFHLFEMPVLGYAGYLPFGLTCMLIVDWLAGFMRQAPHFRTDTAPAELGS